MPGVMHPGAPRLVLASGSAARRALLEAAGVAFSVAPNAVEEGVIKAAMRAEGESADETALALADAKAAGVTDPHAVVIGADQLLVCDGDWFDKPADLPAARNQLLRLRGRRHELVTAVTCWRAGTRFWAHVARPWLTMRRFSDAFLDDYLGAEGEAVLACVGAYRLEGLGVHLFEDVEGEHSAILGLPMVPLLACLRDRGVVMS